MKIQITSALFLLLFSAFSVQAQTTKLNGHLQSRGIPLTYAWMQATVNGYPASDTSHADSKGNFSLVLNDSVLAAQDGPVCLQAMYESLKKHEKCISRKNLNAFQEWSIDKLESSTNFRVSMQPLQSRRSIATFDVLFFNHGRKESKIRIVQLDRLALNETACTQMKTLGNLNGNNAGGSFSVDVQITDMNTHKTYYKRYEKMGLDSSGCFSLYGMLPGFDLLPTDTVKRIRINIESTELRAAMDKLREQQPTATEYIRYQFLQGIIALSVPKKNAPTNIDTYSFIKVTPREFAEDTRLLGKP